MRKRLRIAMVVDPWIHPYNGLVVSTRRFVPALEARGCEVRLLVVRDKAVATPPGAIDFDPLRVPGLDTIMVKMRAPLALPDRARLREAFAGCDLVHVQYPFFLGHGAITEALAMGLPVVSTFHVQPENILMNLGLKSDWLRDRLYQLFIRGFYDRSTVVVAPSEFAADLLRLHGARRPIEVISNGVPDAFFAIERMKAKDGKLRILSVGRLAREKQQETLLHAVAASAHRDRIVLTLAGVGPLENAYRALADRLGIHAAIGPVSDEDLVSLYAGADLFVHASGVELEGMSVLEAKAAGLPVMVSASEDSALSHLVGDEDSRFDPRDPRELAEKMDRWLDDPTALAKRGRANRRETNRFAHARSVDALLRTYKLALQS